MKVLHKLREGNVLLDSLQSTSSGLMLVSEEVMDHESYSRPKYSTALLTFFQLQWSDSRFVRGKLRQTGVLKVEKDR